MIFFFITVNEKLLLLNANFILIFFDCVHIAIYKFMLHFCKKIIFYKNSGICTFYQFCDCA